MAGGVGMIGGTIVGAFVIGVINDGMVMCGVSEFWLSKVWLSLTSSRERCRQRWHYRQEMRTNNIEDIR